MSDKLVADYKRAIELLVDGDRDWRAVVWAIAAAHPSVIVELLEGELYRGRK